MGRYNVSILASTSVPFGPRAVQMQNLALIETERITVYNLYTAWTTWVTPTVIKYKDAKHLLSSLKKD
jgi:hypothetical protein